MVWRATEHSVMETTAIKDLLPDPLRQFVDQRVKEGAYADTSEYLRDLVRRDQEAQAVKRLRELIGEGLASGPATPLTDTDIAAIRQRVASAGK
jgi:antitoxin ParD1/3/4